MTTEEIAEGLLYNGELSQDLETFSGVGGMFFAVYGIIIAVALILALICYIINGIVFSKTARANGYPDYAYLAWIPIANVYQMWFLVADGGREEKRSYALKWFWIYIGLSFLSAIPIIGVVFVLATLYLIIKLYYGLYMKWSGEKGFSILMVVLTVLFTIPLYIYGLMKMNQPFVDTKENNNTISGEPVDSDNILSKEPTEHN